MSARTALRCTLAFFATVLLSVSANAQLFRAYLAVDGNDANPCSLPAPCRLLPAALNAVASGGEIWMLDSANYNTATVTVGKSVSILAVPGAVGSVVATGGPAISITAGSLKVALRNLVIVPLPGGGGTNGIHMTGASTLTIEDSLIANMPQNGLLVEGAGAVTITNTTLRNVGSFAVFARDGANVSISGTKMLENANGGVYSQNNTATATTASVSDSFIAGGGFGVFGESGNAGTPARIFVTRCTIDRTAYAVTSQVIGGGSALVTVSGSMITNNGSAWFQSGGGSVIESFGNNHIRGNASSTGTLTLVGLQ